MKIDLIILDILKEIISSDEILQNKNIELFENGLMESFDIVQMIINIEEKLNIKIPISNFDRKKWNTPNNIIKEVKEIYLKNVN